MEDAPSIAVTRAARRAAVRVTVRVAVRQAPKRGIMARRAENHYATLRFVHERLPHDRPPA
jgi:hypothetical protein